MESGNTKYDSRDNCNAIIETATNTLIKGCTNTVVPNSATSIGNYAFSGCSGLTSIEIPNSVTSIGDWAFEGCSGLISIEIPNSVTSIGNHAFSGCYFQKEKFINNSKCTSSDNWGAILLDERTEDGLWIANNQIIKYIGNGISVIIPNSVTSIGKNVFEGCSLRSLTIGSGVLTIERQNNFSSIKTIWLTNTPPSGYSELSGTVNYVSNDLYTSLKNKYVYKLLSSLFVVDGIKYAIVSSADRTCVAIDCMYDESTTNVHIGETVTYKNISLKVKNVNEYVCYDNPYINKESRILNPIHQEYWLVPQCT